MNRWHDFLDSLATKGGNLLILVFCCILLGAAWMASYHLSQSPDVHAALMATFTGFTGALLGALKGIDRNPKTLNGAPTVTPVDVVDMSGPKGLRPY